MQPQVTVVGGGTGALGRAVVSRLLAAGHTVAVPSRDPAAAELPGPVTVIGCDLADVYAVDRFREQVDSLGDWTALVSCSGGYAGGRAHEVTDEDIAEQLEINLLGPWRLARAAARSMVEHGRGGRIVQVGSRASVEVARGQAAYQVSKAALLRLTEVMAAELHDAGITVNAVLPGTMDTPANRRSMPNADPGRWLDTDSVAAIIEWLLAPEAAMVNGVAIPLFQR